MGWFRRFKNEPALRYAAGRPPHPLYLDGAASWISNTGPDDARQLARLPVNSEIVVEAFPEPNDPPGVALLHEGSRVGHLPTYLSRSLSGAINAANGAGYHVLLRAKSTQRLPARNTIEVQIGGRRPAGSDLVLEVRAALAADLYYWLHLTPQERGTQYFELAWIKTVYHDFYQDRRKALLGQGDSLILPCTFSTGNRPTNPYGDRPPPHTTPTHPDIGTFADVHTDGQHIGELRTSTSHEDVLKILGGCDHGMARLNRWPSNIELRVCIADSDGCLPRSCEPFLWQGERREVEDARLEANWAAIDAEKVDSRPFGHCKAEVADLKRAGDLNGAISLAMKMVDAAEEAATISGRAPHAWVTLDAAIILRKLKDERGEIALLERYLQHCPPGQADAKIAERLGKLC